MHKPKHSPRHHVISGDGEGRLSTWTSPLARTPAPSPKLRHLTCQAARAMLRKAKVRPENDGAPKLDIHPSPSQRYPRRTGSHVELSANGGKGQG